MELERQFERDRRRVSADGPHLENNLDRHRGEIDQLLHAADRVFDSISSVNAQLYLDQNMQAGGQ